MALPGLRLRLELVALDVERDGNDFLCRLTVQFVDQAGVSLYSCCTGRRGRISRSFRVGDRWTICSRVGRICQRVNIVQRFRAKVPGGPTAGFGREWWQISSRRISAAWSVRLRAVGIGRAGIARGRRCCDERSRTGRIGRAGIARLTRGRYGTGSSLWAAWIRRAWVAAKWWLSWGLRWSRCGLWTARVVRAWVAARCWCSGWHWSWSGLRATRIIRTWIASRCWCSRWHWSGCSLWASWIGGSWVAS